MSAAVSLTTAPCWRYSSCPTAVAPISWTASVPTMWKNSRRLGRYSQLMGSASSRSCCHAAVHITTVTAVFVIGSSLMVTVLRYTWCLHLAQNEVPQADAMAHTAATSPFFWKFRASHLRHSARCFPCSYAQVLSFNIIYIYIYIYTSIVP